MLVIACRLPLVLTAPSTAAGSVFDIAAYVPLRQSPGLSPLATTRDRRGPILVVKYATPPPSWVRVEVGWAGGVQRGQGRCMMEGGGVWVEKWPAGLTIGRMGL